MNKFINFLISKLSKIYCCILPTETNTIESIHSEDMYPTNSTSLESIYNEHMYTVSNSTLLESIYNTDSKSNES
nr:hypothetical protein [Wadden Sea poxvirus]